MLILSGLLIYSPATILNVKGNSSRSIQIAIARAKSGDTVYIPPGEYFLVEGIHIHKGITLMGAGESKTIIRRKKIKGGKDFWYFTVHCENADSFRFTKMSVIGNSPENTPGILMKRNCTDFRIDSSTFKKCSRRAIEIHGDSRGVIDHNTFIDNWYTAIVVFGNGEKSWHKKYELGSGNAVYVEDNYFEQKEVKDISMAHHIASNNGSRYVFRYNTVHDGDLASHAIDAHGNKYGWERGSRSYEIYNNTIVAFHRWAGINIRGGDGVIFNNIFKGDFVSPIHLMHEGRNGDGECDYPCTDQIRRLYIWNNICNNKQVEIHVRHPAIIGKNRDYLLKKRSDYEPFEYPHPLIRGKNE